ncbi:MAG: hypothetical protein AAF909_14000 [Pseudomonadota bacterium]
MRARALALCAAMAGLCAACLPFGGGPSFPSSGLETRRQALAEAEEALMAERLRADELAARRERAAALEEGQSAERTALRAELERLERERRQLSDLEAAADAEASASQARAARIAALEREIEALKRLVSGDDPF